MRRLRPDLANSSLAELQAVQEGHGPLQEDIADDLGRFSVVNALMADEHERIRIGKENLDFLEHYAAELLPKAATIRGEFGNDRRATIVIPSNSQTQYQIREIQKNAVWATATNWGWSPPMWPYYILGENIDPHNNSAKNLLLLPAAAANGSSMPTPGPIKVSVNSKDWIARKELVEKFENTELTHEEISRLLDKRSISYKILFGSPGCFRLDGNDSLFGLNTRSHRINEQFIKGTGLLGDNYERINLSTGITKDIWERFSVDEGIARLATDFRVGNELEALLKPEVARTAIDVEDNTSVKHIDLIKGLIGKGAVRLAKWSNS